METAVSSGRKSRMVLSEINVTPLVDVMLVLLIIFMVTAPLMQQGLEVNVPETANSGIPTNEDPFILVVDKNQRITAGTMHIPVQEVRTKLQAIFSTRHNKQLYVRADKKVEYGFVAEVMGEIRAAGINEIGLITLPKTELK